MRVTVFGASGKVGSKLVKNLLDDGWHVIAFVHSVHSFNNSDKLEIIQGDVHNPTDVRRAIKGSDVVVSALGSWGSKQKNIVSSGTQNIIKAMSESGIKRVVTLTGADALVNGDKTGFLSRIMHTLISMSPARKILRDGELHINLLQQSRLDWTVVRSPVMNNNGDPKHYNLTTVKPLPWTTINRQSVALAMVDLVNDDNYINKAPFIRRK